MATQVNLKEVFKTQNFTNLTEGKYKYPRFERGSIKEEVISSEKAARAIQYCEKLDVTPKYGEKGAASSMFVLGHKVLEGMNAELPRASAIVSEVFNGLPADAKETTGFAQVEGQLVGLALSKLVPYTLSKKFSDVLRKQRLEQLLKEGLREEDGKDGDMDDDVRARLQGNRMGFLEGIARQVTKGFTLAFAEIYNELETEWKLKIYFAKKDAERAAIENAKKAEDRKIGISMRGLLEGIDVASMDKDGGGRKTPAAPEPTLSAEETQQLSGLLGAKPARNRKRGSVTDVA